MGYAPYFSIIFKWVHRRLKPKKGSNKSCSKLNFVRKSPWAHKSTSPQSGASELERLIWLKYYFVRTAKYIQFRAQRCQKYTSNQKKLQIKVVRNWILYEKVHQRICLFPSWSGARRLDMVELLFCSEMAKYIQFRAQHCQKYASNQKSKNCWEWNFIQRKVMGAHVNLIKEWS